MRLRLPDACIVAAVVVAGSLAYFVVTWCAATIVGIVAVTLNVRLDAAAQIGNTMGLLIGPAVTFAVGVVIGLRRSSMRILWAGIAGFLIALAVQFLGASVFGCGPRETHVSELFASAKTILFMATTKVFPAMLGGCLATIHKAR